MTEANIAHPGSDHLWVCRTVSGQVGELQANTFLTDDAVEIVMANPTKAEEFCPGGQIICNACDTPLIEGQEVQVSQIDLVDLKEHLVKLDSVTSSNPSE